MTRQLKIARLAQEDLKEIYRYSIEKWGRKQAAKYLLELESCFVQLADNPEKDRLFDELPPYRRILRGSHAIFYRVSDDDALWVIRVLHMRMSPFLHLDDG